MSGTLHSHGMMTLPAMGEVLDGLRDAMDVADVRKVASWVKFLPSAMKTKPSEYVRRLRHLMKRAIEEGDPAMLKVLFTESRRLTTTLDAEQCQRVRWEHPGVDTLLVAALQAGEVKVVEAIMARVEDLEPATVVGLFCDAASEGDGALAARLAALVDLSEPMDQQRAMGAAISGGNLAIVRALRERGIDFGVCRVAPASFSISERTLPVLAELQRMGLDVNAIHPDVRMGTALHTALTLNDYQTLHGLLSHGADPNVRIDGVYLLENALSRTVGKDIEVKHRSAVAAIMDAGGIMPNLVAKHGLNYWHIGDEPEGMVIAAAYFGAERVLAANEGRLNAVSCADHPAIVNQLLPNCHLPGRTTLMAMAAAADNPASVRILSKLGLHPDDDNDGSGEAPLVTAVRRSCASAAQALIECGANHRIEFSGMPLLKWAEKNCNEEIVRTLRAAEMSGKLMDVMSEGGAPSEPSAGVMPL